MEKINLVRNESNCGLCTTMRKKGVTAVASTGQHCLMFSHTKLVQEALECESLKSQDLARVLEESGVGMGGGGGKHKKTWKYPATENTDLKKKKKSCFRSTLSASFPSVQTSKPEDWMWRSGGFCTVGL